MARKNKNTENTEVDEVAIKVIATIKELHGNFEGAVKRMQIINGTLQNIVQSLGGGNTGGGLVRSISELNTSIRSIVDDLGNIRVNVEAPPPAIEQPRVPPLVPNSPLRPPFPELFPRPTPLLPQEPNPPDTEMSDEQAYFRGQRIISVLNYVTDGFDKFSQALQKAIPNLIDIEKITFSVLGQVAGSIASLPDKIINLEQTLFGLGTDLAGFQQQMGFMVDGIVGSTTQNLQNAATLYSLGFRGNNKSLLELAAKMDLTGQKTMMLLSEFTRMSTVLGLSTQQMIVLSKVVDETSTRYGVKTDELIQSLSKVQNQNVMATAGFGAQFMQNLTPLLGEFTRNRTEITNLINALTRTDTLMKLAPVDPALTGLVRQMERASSPQELKAVLTEITGRLASFAQTMAGQAGAAGQMGNLPTTAILADILNSLGAPVADATQLFNALTGNLSENEIALKKQSDLQESFKASLEALVTQVTPLIQSIVNVATGFMQMFDNIGGKALLVIGVLAKFAVMITSFGTNILSTIIQNNFYRSQLNALTAAVTQGTFAHRFASSNLIRAGIGISTWAAAITGGLSLILTGAALIGTFATMNNSATDENTDATKQNTDAFKASNETKFRDSVNQNSIMQMMSRNISYVLSREDAFVTKLNDMVTKQEITNDRMKQLVDVGVQSYVQSLDVNSTKYQGIK